MPQGIARRMLGELKTIAADSAAYRGNWKPLQGCRSGGCASATGGRSATCSDELVLLVVKVAPRGDAYT